MKKKSATSGGILKGDAHAAPSGGIKTINVDSGETLLVEDKEAVINKRSMEMKEKVVCEGTPKQVASAVNELGGGVSFAPGASCHVDGEKKTMADGGMMDGEPVADNAEQNAILKTGGEIRYGYPFPMGYKNIPHDILQHWLEEYLAEAKQYHGINYHPRITLLDQVLGNPYNIQQVAFVAEVRSEKYGYELRGREYLYPKDDSGNEAGIIPGTPLTDQGFRRTSVQPVKPALNPTNPIKSENREKTQTSLATGGEIENEILASHAIVGEKYYFKYSLDRKGGYRIHGVWRSGRVEYKDKETGDVFITLDSDNPFISSSGESVRVGSDKFLYRNKRTVLQRAMMEDGGELGGDNDLQRILKESTIEGNVVKLPPGQLDRKLYMDVAKALNLIGGKWKGGKVMGFEFQEDPTEMPSEIAGGAKRNLKKEFQFFGTPAPVAKLLVDMANITRESRILEPEAGQGAIVKAINEKFPGKQVDCFELMPINQAILKKIPTVNFLGPDFLKATSYSPYDVIIANPPFAKNQDIDHVRMMYHWLKPGGEIVTIMSKHWQLSGNKKETEFRNWLESIGAVYEDIPPGAFKESGTMIQACIVTIYKAHEEPETKSKNKLEQLVDKFGGRFIITRTNQGYNVFDQELDETARVGGEIKDLKILEAAIQKYVDKHAKENKREADYGEKENKFVYIWDANGKILKGVLKNRKEHSAQVIVDGRVETVGPNHIYKTEQEAIDDFKKTSEDPKIIKHKEEWRERIEKSREPKTHAEPVSPRHITSEIEDFLDEYDIGKSLIDDRIQSLGAYNSYVDFEALNRALPELVKKFSPEEIDQAAEVLILDGYLSPNYEILGKALKRLNMRSGEEPLKVDVKMSEESKSLSEAIEGLILLASYQKGPAKKKTENEMRKLLKEELEKYGN